jgi:hypothetical protein
MCVCLNFKFKKLLNWLNSLLLTGSYDPIKTIEDFA